MKPAPFEYIRSTTLDEAFKALEEPDAKILAGSQSLGPMLNFRLARPSLLVDITSIEQLSYVDADDDGIHIGACVTHAALEDGLGLGACGHILSSVAGDIAYRAVRTRGTVGGSLAHADPAADWITVMTALGAEVTIQGPGGTRRIGAEQLVLGAFVTDLAADEILTAVTIPAVGASTRWCFKKYCRKVGEFAEAMCAVFSDNDRGIDRIVLGATDGKPILLDEPGRIIVEPQAADTALAAAGLADDPYLGRIRAAILRRAIAELTSPAGVAA